ncbi:MAG TPA: radical SAM protein [Vicinamibacterales bacterium]|nr:radical SAM protein [Vicinamibacterales bacterium]
MLNDAHFTSATQAADVFARPGGLRRTVALVLPSSDEKRSSAISQAGAEHLGLGYIAAYLRARAVEVTVFNFQVDTYVSYWEMAEKAPPVSVDTCARQIIESGADIVGMSITGITIREALGIANRLKELKPEIFIAWGGHQAFYSAKDLIERELSVDAVVASDGEITMGRLVDCLSLGGSIKEIPGLYVRDGRGRMLYTGPPPEPELDELPRPARDTLEMMIARGMNITDARITTSRGCPFKCTFCVDPSLGYRVKWRARSAELVVAEMKELVEKYGIKFFWFSEDNFILPTKQGRDRATKIADLLVEAGLDIGYRALLRADAINGETELVRKLIRSGLRCVYIGIESGSPRRLVYLKKHETPEEYRAVLDQLKATRVGLQIGFIMFDPFTTWDDLAIDAEFLRSVGQMYLYSNYCQTLDVFPGTDISLTLIEKGMLSKSFSYDSPYDEYQWEDPAIGQLGRAFMRAYGSQLIELDKHFQRFAVVDVPTIWRASHAGQLDAGHAERVQAIADEHLGTLNQAGFDLFTRALELGRQGWGEAAFHELVQRHYKAAAAVRVALAHELLGCPAEVRDRMTSMTGITLANLSEAC